MSNVIVFKMFILIYPKEIYMHRQYKKIFVDESSCDNLKIDKTFSKCEKNKIRFLAFLPSA